METIHADICVIGAGSGGLSVAAGASQMGAKVVLIERGKMGGDCLNYGCVPSKALIAAGKQAHAMSAGEKFGIAKATPQVDFAKVHEHVHGVIAGIAPHDSVERFEGLGVTVVQAEGRFADRRTVVAGNKRITARRFVIATGSRPSAPPIKGLDSVNYLTNETIFENTELPEHLIIVGGGPIGMEMAQAYRRLGARVTVLEAFKVFGKDDPELVAIVVKRLEEEGVDIREGAMVEEVAERDGKVEVTLKNETGEERISGTHLLVAAGRRPNIGNLNLEAANVKTTKRGIEVDARLRTSNKKIFAIGDAAGGLQFTHVAGYHSGIVIRNALFRVPAKADHSAVPWATYTDPELAHVGLTEELARKEHGDNVRVLKWEVAENDRARAERNTEGMIKVVVGKKGRILGATIAASKAGELIQPWVLAMSTKLKIGAMATFIAPYPTLGEISKRAAGDYYTPTLYSPRVRFFVKLLGKLG